MSDHGTKVQCPKCNEWVSGSHNCDIWTQECKECEGSGYKGDCKGCSVINKRTKGEHCDDHCTCPHCKGSGGFNLVVECECEFITTRLTGECYITGEHVENICPNNCHRPLSCEEVEELAKEWSCNSVDELIRGIQGGWLGTTNNNVDPDNLVVTYKGQPVKLMPREG